LPVAAPHTPETTALGAGLLALVGVGAHSTLAEACASAVRITERFDPRPREQAIYAEAHALYREAYFALLPVFDRAAGIQRIQSPTG